MQIPMSQVVGLAVVRVVFAVMSAEAGLVFTIENPGVQATTVPGAVTETFDTLPIGPTGPFQTAIGSFSSGGAVVLYSDLPIGGAFQTDYYAIGSESGFTTATLSLAKPETYFGMWWSAGDALNHVELYDGATLLGSYAIGDISAGLSHAYYGNPNNGYDTAEPFVYLDFTTTGLSRITSVKFLNDGLGSGIEMDNLSVSDQPIAPPGHAVTYADPVPDGGSTKCLLVAACASLIAGRRMRFLAELL